MTEAAARRGRSIAAIDASAIDDRHDLQRPAHSQVPDDEGSQKELHRERDQVQIESVETAQEGGQLLLVGEGRLGHGAELILHHHVHDKRNGDDRHDDLQVPVAANARDDIFEREVLFAIL